MASTTSELRDATAAESAVPHACCGLSVVELVIAPRLMRRSLAWSGRRSLRRSIVMRAPYAVRCRKIRLRGDERGLTLALTSGQVNGLGPVWFHRMDAPLAFEPAIAKLDALSASTDAAGLGLKRAPGSKARHEGSLAPQCPSLVDKSNHPILSV
jgi:hypothetical protein